MNDAKNADAADEPTSSTTGGHKKDKYPYIHPEELRKSEHLAVDADDIEDFIEHFSHHDEHEKAHTSERKKKLSD